MQPRIVSILGVGLLGGSIGLAVKQRLNNCRVIGYGHRKSTLDAALAGGAIDEGYEDAVRAVRGADLVILCTPVGTFPELLRSIAPAVGGALVTDVGSTKRSVVKLAEQLLASPNLFVGSHPMAGSEKRGIEHARADLCNNALCILTPTKTSALTTVSTVDEFWQSLGMRTQRLSPEDHDRRVAQVSHLPHALAAILVHLADADSLEVAGKGFADLTRIAGGDGALWRDILIDNRDNMRDCITRMKSELDQFSALLEADSGADLKAFLDDAASRRARLGKGDALDRREQ